MSDLIAQISMTSVDSWIAAGGYLGLFLILTLCGLGLPLPEDIPLIVAGAAAASGKLDLGGVMVAGWLGIMSGDAVLLHVARHLGPRVTKMRLLRNHVSPQRIEWVTEKFKVYGIWVVAVGRLFAGVRAAVVIVAGTIHYSRVKFFLADGLAAMISGGLFVMLGYWLGKHMTKLLKGLDNAKHLTLTLLLLALIAAIGYWLWTRKGARRVLHVDEP